MTIDRCLCHGTLFADMAEAARASGACTVSALQDDIDFGHGCQLCHPYARRMLRTGETAFHEVVTEVDEPAPEAPVRSSSRDTSPARALRDR